MIAIRRGFRRENEFDVSPRMLEAPQGGIAKGKRAWALAAGLYEQYINTGKARQREFAMYQRYHCWRRARSPMVASRAT